MNNDKFVDSNILNEKKDIEYLIIPGFEERRKKQKRIKYAIISGTGLTIIFLCLFLYNIFVTGKVDFKLNGNKIIETEVLNDYHDTGVTAAHCTIIKCQKINKHVITKNNVNTNVLGVYNIDYTLKYRNKNIKLTRQIKIVDKTKPEIILNGSDKPVVCPDQKYVEEGYKATDNYDGDITKKVVVMENDNTVTYKVEDSSTNVDEKTRNIIFEDKEKPSITLKGNKNIYIEFGGSYKEPGYSAGDKCDGDITSSVKVINNVNTKKLGT